MGPALGFSIQNGVSIQGPNDAGDYNIDEAGFILPCGGHVTPPVDAMQTGPMASPPLYHYHKAPDCLDEFVEQNKPFSHGGTQGKHGGLIGYALDGFGIYTFQDIGGAAPVLDECGGHFGPVDDDDLTTVVYHYHTTTYTPCVWQRSEGGSEARVGAKRGWERESEASNAGLSRSAAASACSWTGQGAPGSTPS
jgi:hypothetical protein